MILWIATLFGLDIEDLDAVRRHVVLEARRSIVDGADDGQDTTGIGDAVRLLGRVAAQRGQLRLLIDRSYAA